MIEKKEVPDWPPVEGRYNVGDVKSPVAVCTIASIDDIELDMSKIAALGKCVTENVGIEKIVQNLIMNPNIRYLILCGKESKGHFVGQAFMSLKEKGIDDENKIVGARGPIPFLKNITKEEVERYREQITPINIVGETDPDKIHEVVDKCLKEDPGYFKGEEIKITKHDEGVEDIVAKKNEKFILDPSGFFKIKVDKNIGKIVVHHYASHQDFLDNKINKKIVGNDAIEIGHTISRMGLIGKFEQTVEHALDIGQELQKAEIALKNDLEYVQDQPVSLLFPKKKSE
jgi:tetrahydromethanopterin S-methyltransferase subunit A